jgi:hypothetical protein
MITSIFLALRRPWQEALAIAIAISVASQTFEDLKATLTPTLGSLGTIFVSASTAGVAAFIVWAVVGRLIKLH